MSGWLEGWQRVDNPRSGGGTYDPENEGYPWRLVLHTIEGSGFPNTATHQYPPQLWYNPQTRAKIQTIPLDRSGYALYQGADVPYYTNRARAIQVELVGFAKQAGSWPDDYLVNIAQDVVAPVVNWVRSQGGDIDLTDPAVPLPGAIPNSAREDAPQRLDPHVWAFGPVGMVGHRHVPMGDDHWDAGSLDMRKIAAYARELLGSSGSAGTVTPPKPKGFLMALSDQQQTDLYNAVMATQSSATATNWMVGNMVPKPGTEGQTISADVRATRQMVNQVLQVLAQHRGLLESTFWMAGAMTPIAGMEDKTVSSDARATRAEVVELSAKLDELIASLQPLGSADQAAA